MGTTPKNRLVESYSLLTPCPAGDKGKGRVWRITGNLGYGDSLERNTRYAEAPPRAAAASIVVLDDGALGFRHRTNELAWPAEFRDGKPAAVDWVVLKTSAPVAQGDLWRQACKRFCDRLVVVVSAADLRQEEVSITEGLSWEHTAQDLLQELTLNKSISDLTQCRHLVVSLGTDGALWLGRRADGTSRYRLVFDPGGLEGAWARSVTGQVWGGTSCLVAAIVAELAAFDVAPTGAGTGAGADDAGPDIGAGIMRGLSAMRHLLRVGHGAADGGGGGDRIARQGFPPEPVVEDLLKPSCRYRIADVPATVASVGKSKAWTIVSGEPEGAAARPLYGLARRVALFGPRALVDELPYARFGKLLVVDRVEIESLRGLERLIKGYERTQRPSKPLSIAVFGAPGSGKSFGVKQIAKTVLGDTVSILEFNLSQYSDPGELIGAFHQVRDKVLGRHHAGRVLGRVRLARVHVAAVPAGAHAGRRVPGGPGHAPDRQVRVRLRRRHELRLRQLLAARRNGPRGRRRHTPRGREGPLEVREVQTREGPRLRQPAERLPERRRPEPAPEVRRQDRQNGSTTMLRRDLSFPIRRALLMRATGGFVGAAEGDEMDIDSGLLTAFLEIGKYEHGARSLETIMGLTRGAGPSGLRRSCPTARGPALAARRLRRVHGTGRPRPALQDEQRGARAGRARAFSASCAARRDGRFSPTSTCRTPSCPTA